VYAAAPTARHASHKHAPWLRHTELTYFHEKLRTVTKLRIKRWILFFVFFSMVARWLCVFTHCAIIRIPMEEQFGSNAPRSHTYRYLPSWNIWSSNQGRSLDQILYFKKEDNDMWARSVATKLLPRWCANDSALILETTMQNVIITNTKIAYQSILPLCHEIFNTLSNEYGNLIGRMNIR